MSRHVYVDQISMGLKRGVGCRYVKIYINIYIYILQVLEYIICITLCINKHYNIITDPGEGPFLMKTYRIGNRLLQ